MEINVNWSALAALVAGLFVAQIASGLIEGLFLPIGSLGQLMGLLLSFVLCLAAFAIFAFLQPDRPFLHGAAGLGIYLALGVALAGMFGSRIQSFSWSVAAIQWAVLAFSMAVGVFAGRALRRLSRSSANA